MGTTLRDPRVGERGQAVVEFSLVVSLLFLLLLGVMEFGNLMHIYLSVEYASREGARVSTLGKTDAEVTSAVKDALPRTVDSSKISVAISPALAQRVSGATVTVRVSYTVPVYTKWFAEVFHENGVALAGSTSMRVE